MTALPSHLVGLTPTTWQERVAIVPINDPDIVDEGDFIVEFSSLTSDIGRCQRKGDVEERDRCLMRFGHLLFVAASKSGVFLSYGMALKFPGKCSRCGETGSCNCGDSYPREQMPMPDEPDPKHLAMTLRQWQADMRMRFHHKNLERGFEATLGRLNEEIGEVAKAQRRVRNAQRARQVVDKKLLREMFAEFADVLAWWIAVLNLCEVEAEDLAYQVLAA